MRAVRLWVLFSLLLAACTSSGEPALQIAGSTSVQPLAEMLGEAYTSQTGLRVSVQGGGSTAGIYAVSRGIASVGMISRRLLPAERAQGLLEHGIAYDLLVVVVHPENPVSGLTHRQAAQLFGGEIVDWSAVGGTPGPVHLVAREAGSGSREAFRLLIGPISPSAIIQSSAGAIRAAVMENPQAIGFVNLAAFRLGGLRAVAVDGLKPTHLSYPLKRQLSFVTRKEVNPEAEAFLHFMRSRRAAELIAQEGLIPLGQ
jgi:phosphate transport system substrate-binding protein